MRILKVLMIGTSLLSCGFAMDGGAPQPLTVERINQMEVADLAQYPQLNNAWQVISRAASEDVKKANAFKQARGKVQQALRQKNEGLRVNDAGTMARIDAAGQAAAQATNALRGAEDNVMQAQGQVADIHATIEGIIDLLEQRGRLVGQINQYDTSVQDLIGQLNEFSNQAGQVSDAERVKLDEFTRAVEQLAADRDAIAGNQENSAQQLQRLRDIADGLR